MISVIVPCYNEQDAIVDTIKKLQNVMEPYPYEIIIIDDCSTDKSVEKVEEILKPPISLVKNPYNLGYSASIKKGLKLAMYDKVAIVDADGTYPIEKMPDLIQYINSYDMVVGARSLESEGQEWIKKYPKLIINMLANFVSPIKIEDLNSGMRIFDKNKAMEFYNIYPEKFSFTSTITLAFVTNSYTIKYVPINYKKRIGKSKMKPHHFIDFLSLITRIVFFFKPLKFFIPIGALLLGSGLSWGLWHIFDKGNVGTTSSIAIIAGMQIILMGFIAEMITKRR